MSVVVPAYNNASFIAATLDSILAQTYRDLEVIVADHSSTDTTWSVLSAYADRVLLLRTPAGGGAERNWNRVSEAASGEYIKLVCGDDLLYPEIVAVQVAALDAAGAGAVLAASSRDIVDAAGRTVLRDVGLAGLRGRVPGRVALRRSVLVGANIFGEPACVLLRRSVLERIGGWHGDPGFMIDQATYARALLHGDLVAVPGPLAAFRLNAGQLSVALAKEQARSAAAMHHQLALHEPGLLSRRDVVRGDAMARVRAWQRRAVYAWVGRRMRVRA